MNRVPFKYSEWIPDWVKATLDEWTRAATIADGRLFRCVSKVLDPPGGLQNRADENSLIRKFTALSEHVLGKERSHRATEIILGAEKISELKTLLVAPEDEAARVVEARGRREVARLAHEGSVRVPFSPDDTLVATGSAP